MKSAEDVAEYLANLGNLHEGEYFTDRVNIISSALNAFADECVKESELRTTNQMMVRVLPNMIAKARADALEEAATMIEKRKGIQEHHSDIAGIVRALKDAK